MNISNFRPLFAAITLLASGLHLAACERQEPKPEKDVVFQSSGHFSLADGPEFASVLIVRNTKKSLTLEIRENKTQALLATGTLPGEVVKDLFAEVRGPLRSMIHSSTMRVAQDCTLKRPVQNPEFEVAAGAIGLTGPSGNSSPTAPQTLVIPSPVVIPIVTEGMLEFVGTRNIEYNTGLLQRWMDGMLTVRFNSSSGQEAARFTGLIARQMIDRDNVYSAGTMAVGTSVIGTMRSVGDAGTAGSHDVLEDVTLALALPYGAGKIEPTRGDVMPIILEFDPNKDVLPPGGHGTLKGVKQSETHVEAQDDFVGTIKFPAADIRGGLTGTGDGDVSYSLKIAVNSHTIKVSGRISLRVDLKAENGASKHTFQASGSQPNVETTLDW